MSVAAASVTVKGTVIKGLMKFVNAELTPAQIEQALSQLPPEFAKDVSGSVLVSSLFPVHLVNKFTAACANAKGEQVEAFARRAGRASADDAVKSVFRILVMVLTPTAILKKGTGVWRTIYSAGDFTVETVGAAESRVHLRDFPSEPVQCARITGWMEQLGEMTKAKGLSIKHTRCVCRKDDHCEWHVRWDG
ncbi:MAG: hypothetical protein WC538_06975 [Thermoanaerobaculia bacterium]|jgi:hypothetical protein